MRTVLTWILIIILLIGGAYLGSPWWAVWSLERAAKAGDSHAVAETVDLPAVRASLSPTITAELQRALSREQQKPRGLFEKFTLFASKLFAPKPVDALLTPEGVTWMLKTGQAPPWINPFQRERTRPAGEPAMDAGHTGYTHDDFDQFHAKLDNKLSPGRSVTLTMLRRGFITWKVVGLDLLKTRSSTTTSSTSTAVTKTSGVSADYAPTGNRAP